MKNMKRGVPNIFKDGVRTLSGVEQAVVKNCQACKELSNITKTSFGPNGMNKMLINHLGKMFVTSDTATMMRELEVDHPAAKILALACHMQEMEIGDGSNFVVTFGGELLGQAEELVKMGLHPTEILSGYQKAAKKATEILETLVAFKPENKDMFNVDVLTSCIKTSIASKQYGYENVIAPLVAQACLTALPKNVFNFNVDNVRVVKLLGGNLHSSEVVKGMIIPYDTLTSIKEVKDAKIAVFSNSLSAPETETKGTILIENADELMNYSLGEEKEAESIVKSLYESGINCVITGGSVDDIMLHFCEKYKIMLIKITSKFELRRICKAVNARPLVQVGYVRTEEIGYCSHVYVREVGASKLTIFAQDNQDSTSIATILLRASTNNILNDLERAVDDGVNVIKAMSKDTRFVAGAGACEIELAKQLTSYASTVTGVEQYAIQKFAESFESIPRTLAENSGHTSMDVLSLLYAAHEQANSTFVGLDITTGQTLDSQTNQIFDLFSAKANGIRLVMEAAATILRVDQIIQAKQAGGPKFPKKDGHWDDD